MVENNKRPRIVGNFIRQRREALGLSQRALGLLFTPPVTTQFISNVERGVTPLPPAHIPTLTKALGVGEAEFMSLLEQEYAYKLSGRLGKGDSVPTSLITAPNGGGALPVAETDYPFMRTLYTAYVQADPARRQQFANAVEKILGGQSSSSSSGYESHVTQ
ncbi:MAG TPA: helix-turn-helix transcriptional regulator [Bdellovibrionota bacterium]|nr:helix-turn-helix transcriptional regulator [Bdellovibrionota bacterium]